jgi:formate-dependent nitrite reductase cytochrome c552 subunit
MKVTAQHSLRRPLRDIVSDCANSHKNLTGNYQSSPIKNAQDGVEMRKALAPFAIKKSGH